MRDYVVQKTLYFMVNNPTPNDVKLPGVSANDATAKDILSIVFGALAAVAILIIIIAAFNIITGGGDPEKISRGKRAVVYALVGLAVALSAEAIVTLVLDRL